MRCFPYTVKNKIKDHELKGLLKKGYCKEIILKLSCSVHGEKQQTFLHCFICITA